MKSILVANRGEIALRIMRSIQEMGIETVAVYSDADKFAPHVAFADRAFHIGPPPSSESYLKGEYLLEICKREQIDGIHPGYGFLSENAAFARRAHEMGITFIGPSPDAIDLMGSKLAAKAAVKAFNVPLVPGTDTAITDIEKAKIIAAEIGFPILIKASAGGGGKGMRIVEDIADFESQMMRAVSEAEKSFGDGSVFIEKYITSPRHIEIQVLGDTHGNYVHLFERECSIQRRHQKVIEEAPSSVLSPQLRQKMGAAAIAVCKSCNYSNAGTVEFILDENHNFYFLEMNTRLQVEHPVTEMITGIDLVKEQVRIAKGEKLRFTQNDIHIHGHAIEARVYAEDPANNFLPDIGTLHIYKRPQGHGIRVDDGLDQGMEVPIHYDPMIAKLITHASDREAAIAKMRRAIKEYTIIGVETTLPFCDFVMQHPAFISGEFDTHFVQQHFDAEKLKVKWNEKSSFALAASAASLTRQQISSPASSHRNNSSAWKKNRKHR